ncbi:MAG: sugar phosphate nucleotidyltransferase, partial [Gammaproteobacteria bacterium]|nr:sugar phosphate nucleotidyltransferase [Gammaproteobacteria bacterium]
MKAIIPVAGLGTRMLPATKAIPKELLPVYDRPIIQHVVEEAIAAGITEIILITRSGKEAIENHFDAHYELEHRLEKNGKVVVLKQVKNIIPSYVQVVSIRQEDALGLGHAILCARRLIDKDEPFAVLLPDVLLLDPADVPLHSSFTAAVRKARHTGIGQIMVEQVAEQEVDKYGIVDINGSQLAAGDSAPIKRMVEKPKPADSPSNLAVLGRYILPPRVMTLLEDIAPGAGGEIQLTD